MPRPIDRSTVDRLVVEHLPVALRFALRLTGSTDTAEDVVQESLCRVLRSWRSYRGDATFRTWLLQIVVNVDRDRSAADAWLAERLPERSLTLAHDPEGALLARCGAGGMPAAYVVDRDGVVRFAESGYALDRVAAIERAAEAVAAPAASK